MTLSAECAECGEKHNVKDEVAGKRFRCKKCGQPITVPMPERQVDSNLERADDLEAEDGVDEDFDRQARTAALRRRTRARNKPQKNSKAKRAGAKRKKVFVANGLRFVLAAFSLQVVAFLCEPLGVWVVLSLRLIGTILAVIGQVMCLAVPATSRTRNLIYGVIGLNVLWVGLRLASFLAPLLIFVASFASLASFFLFVFALKRLASFVGSEDGEMHGKSILNAGAYIGALFGLFVVQSLSPGAVLDEQGVSPWGLAIGTIVASVFILFRYVDLIGCLKDKLDSPS